MEAGGDHAALIDMLADLSTKLRGSFPTPTEGGNEAHKRNWRVLFLYFARNRSESVLSCEREVHRNPLDHSKIISPCSYLLQFIPQVQVDHLDPRWVDYSTLYRDPPTCWSWLWSRSVFGICTYNDRRCRWTKDPLISFLTLSVSVSVVVSLCFSDFHQLLYHRGFNVSKASQKIP